MMHKRRWSVAQLENADALVHELKRCIWCLCAGFQVGRYLFLNDATSEDGAQEYAVLFDRHGDYLQIESITVSSTEPERLGEIVKQALAGMWDLHDFAQIVDVRIDSPQSHGRCHLCA
jgi:hypothetical protein